MAFDPISPSTTRSALVDLELPTVKDSVIGISGARQNAAVAVAVGGQLVSYCEQERVSRVRRAALEPGRLPVEALDAALRAACRERTGIARFAVAEDSVSLPAACELVRHDHHFAHAATAFLTSPFESALVVVADRHSVPPVSVWKAGPDRLTNQFWPWNGVGFAALYSRCAELMEFGGREHLLENVARLFHDDTEGERLRKLFWYGDGRLNVDPRWTVTVADWLREYSTTEHRARVASTFQSRIAAVLLEFLAHIKRRHQVENLCLGGGLFYNTTLNTRIAESGLFKAVHISPNPGNAGLAAGAALAVDWPKAARRSDAGSPFLGPEYSAEEIKQTLDNCKISYECLSDGAAVDVAADALSQGLLVGWFDGRMEWGPRALGHRSILASPLSRYVLDNVNHYLKQRELYRACSLSVPEEDCADYFSGPRKARYMEFDFAVQCDALRPAVPPAVRSLRVQTVEPSQSRFHALHKAFGALTGVDVLVNTSFNGFSEPIVCSPRDALRVFFGTGVDLLVLGRFVVRK